MNCPAINFSKHVCKPNINKNLLCKKAKYHITRVIFPWIDIIDTLETTMYHKQKQREGDDTIFLW